MKSSMRREREEIKKKHIIQSRISTFDYHAFAGKVSICLSYIKAYN